MITSLHAAIRERDLKAIRGYVAADPAVLEARCERGWTPLIVAGFEGCAEVIDLLLALGADPNATNPKGTTPLMFAKGFYLRTGNRGALERLLAGGADPDARDAAGLTLLDYVPDDRRDELRAILARPVPTVPAP